MEKPILKKLNELEYHYTLLEEEVKMNYDTRNILNLIHETRSLVENLTKPNIKKKLQEAEEKGYNRGYRDGLLNAPY